MSASTSNAVSLPTPIPYPLPFPLLLPSLPSLPNQGLALTAPIASETVTLSNTASHQVVKWLAALLRRLMHLSALRLINHITPETRSTIVHRAPHSWPTLQRPHLPFLPLLLPLRLLLPLPLRLLLLLPFTLRHPALFLLMVFLTYLIPHGITLTCHNPRTSLKSGHPLIITITNTMHLLPFLLFYFPNPCLPLRLYFLPLP